jgi:hypothetical protein
MGRHFQRKTARLIRGQLRRLPNRRKNLPAQQKTAALPFGVIVLRAVSNQLSDLRPLVPEILAALATLQPGDVTTVIASQD